MSTSLDTAIVGFLRTILEYGPVNLGGGICYNIRDLRSSQRCEHLRRPDGTPYGMVDILARLEELWARWPHFSGNLQYPVPAPAIATAVPGFHPLAKVEEWWFNKTCNVWHDEYGDMRLDLIRWLIVQLEGRQ